MRKPVLIAIPVACGWIALMAYYDVPILFALSGLLPNGFGIDLDAARAQATNIVRLAVFLGVIASGQTLVIISGSEGIDLSAGSVVTLTAILTYVVVNGADEKVLLGLLVALAVGVLIGFLNGVGITFLKISPFVMTLGMSGVVTGAIIVTTHENVTRKDAPIMTRLIARHFSLGIPIPNAIIIWLVFGILMWLRLALYRRLYTLESTSQLAEVSDELRDRFGAPPDEVTNLFRAIEIRLAAARRGFVRVGVNAERLGIDLPPETDTAFYESNLFQDLMTRVSLMREEGVLLRQEGKNLRLTFPLSNSTGDTHPLGQGTSIHRTAARWVSSPH